MPRGRCLLLILLLPAAVVAAPGTPGKFDWPAWQGPHRDAICKETGLLPTWPKEGLKLAWKANGIGASYSTPSIVAGRVFLMGARDKQEFVYALDEDNGKLLWQCPIGSERSKGGGYPGPRSTPTVDGDRLYALGLSGDLVCVDAVKGKIVWRRDLVKEYGGAPGDWGYSESPLIDGDKVIVTPGGKKATLAAFKKANGDLVWTAQVPQGDAAGYSSIIAANIYGTRQYIQFMQRGVVSVEASTGRYLWRYNAPANGTANISTPIARDDLVFAASAYGKGGGLAQITRKAGMWTVNQTYFTSEMQNHHGGMILLNGYLYGNSGARLACLEFKTGKVKWTSPTPGKGSILFADGCLYYRNEGKNGTLYLVEANPDKYVERGRFDQPERSKRNAWAHPVIANGRLYLGDQDLLLCYDVKK